ncbi:hypothetical protein ACLKA6_017963 [Drosophila palustris]
MNIINQTPETPEMREIPSVFRKSGVTARSPVNTPAQGGTEEARVDMTKELTPKVTNCNNGEPPFRATTLAPPLETPNAQQSVIQEHNSPRQELILKMRALEEESLLQCKAVLRKMKLAMLKQRNISMDVKDGASELSELLDVIASYRNSWKNAEKERTEDLRKKQKRVLHSEDVDATPTTALQKRIATSPAVQDSNKKPKNAANKTDFQVVTRKKAVQKRDKDSKANQNKKADKVENGVPRTRTRIRPDAVLIKPAEGKSYAEVLSDLRRTVKPEDSESDICSIRKTRTGDMLLELSKGSKTQKLCDAIQGYLKEAATVKVLSPTAKIEIRDLDSLTEESEVKAAIAELTNCPAEEITVRMTGTNTLEQRRAFIVLSEEDAGKVLKESRIKIGWTRCRVKRSEDIKRCFKCFGINHVQSECSGPDRRDLCIRCGESGHKMKGCTKRPRCCLCAQENLKELNHFPGSNNCAVRIRKTKL